MVKLKDGSTAKSRTRKVAAVAAAVAVVAGVVTAAAPATAADYPTSSFAISYGASYYNGTVTWYDRSVGVTGTLKAVGCLRANAAVWAGGTRLDPERTSLWCDRTGTTGLSLEANVAGGADRVDIWLADSSGDPLAGVTCYPTSSFCL
ncbi:hypothetical protein IOD16_17215 [Saccharothrix sp. 6-C]|uniref:hypothetical protein n=1 Tax=Saccharothrix sp. 6-C TaxID=2781735 RepID=UPI001917947E|nr:hypothetical protein [Saccharothrix sp. 6-C]QQQ79975.1 hypothetical protein IOD16_17215 [Saccharothrix sp. 6-C]